MKVLVLLKHFLNIMFIFQMSGTCNMKSTSEILCKVPEASSTVASILNSQQNTSPSRRKRQVCTGANCIETKVYVKLDGIEYKFSLSYFRDPTINKFGGDSIRLYPSDTHKLIITVCNIVQITSSLTNWL